MISKKFLIGLNVLICTVLIIFTFASVRVVYAGDEGVLLRPLPSVEITDNVADRLQNDREPYLVRIGKVEINTEILISIVPPTISDTAPLLKGRQFTVSFFPGIEISVNINSELWATGDNLNLGGKATGNELSTFTMTMTENNYIIRYQDLESSMMYKAFGDTHTGIGQVEQIDITKMPPRYQ